MKSFSEETRRKMSESAKKRCTDPAWIEAQKNRGTKLDLNAVKAMYERGMTQMEIAAELHTTQKIVFNFMRRHGIKARSAAKREQTRENNAYWKGGARIENGYKCLGKKRKRMDRMTKYTAELRKRLIDLRDELKAAYDSISQLDGANSSLMAANEKLAADRKALINELCQYCGKYKQAHEGSCDGCKWREM